MLLSNDLLILEINDVEFYYIYNQFTHQIVKMHKLLYDFLVHSSLENGGINEEDLSLHQKTIMLEKGILIPDADKYLSQKYIPPFETNSFNLKTVYIHLTMLCNLNCEYCYQKENIRSYKQEFSTENWLEVITVLKNAGAENLIFTGGEPSLHEGLHVILKSAKTLGFHITLLTNGTMLDAITQSFEFIDNCIVSLDGLSASKRKGVQQYDVMKKILQLPKESLDKISVRSVIARNYEDEVINLGNDLQKNGIPHIKTICLPYNDAGIDCIPDYEKYDLYDMNSALTTCGAGTGLIAIDPNGYIFPCQSLMYKEFLISNIFDSDWMNKIRENDTCQKLRSYQSHKNEKCTTCELKYFCKGGCRSIAYTVYHDIEHCNDFLCGYYKKSINMKIKSICD